MKSALLCQIIFLEEKKKSKKGCFCFARVVQCYSAILYYDTRKFSLKVSPMKEKQRRSWKEGRSVNVSLYLMLLSLKSSPK